MMRCNPKVLLGLVVACFLGFPGNLLRAELITFSPLTGPNLRPYTGHSEGNFMVTPTLGRWFEGHAFGNPVPSIFGGPIGEPETSAISVTELMSRLFTFASVQITSNGAAGSAYVIEGFLDGNVVLSTMGTITSVNTFVTIVSPDPSQALDRLSIEVSPAKAVTSFNIDNINVSVDETVIPEPASLALLGLGALGLLGYGWQWRERGS